MGKTHVAAGCLLTAVVAPPVNEVLGLGLSPAELAIGVGIGAVAGVLPDIDHPDSFITHGVIPGGKIFGPIGKGIGYLLCIPPRIVGVGARATMNHRGGTHSALFMLGWTLLAAPIYAAVFALGVFLASVVWTPLSAMLGINATFQTSTVIDWLLANLPAITPLVMLSVFLGYLAHLLTDSMTKVPVPWPWPFSKKRYCILPKAFRITTDSFIENTLIRPLFCILLIAAFVWNIGVPLGKETFTDAKSSIEGRTEEKKKSKSNKNKAAKGQANNKSAGKKKNSKSRAQKKKRAAQERKKRQRVKAQKRRQAAKAKAKAKERSQENLRPAQQPPAQLEF